MNTLHSKNRYGLLLAVLFMLSMTQAWAETFDSTKKKEMNQTFNVGTSDRLQVDNRYGNITITNWDKNQIGIQVVIEARANSESDAQRMLDRVKVDLTQTGNIVYATTSLSNQSDNQGNNRLTINYYISKPSKLAFRLVQKYGNINLPEKNEGECAMEVKYGNINAGSFTAPLSIEAGYSNIKMDDVKDMSLEAGYCGNVTFNNGNNLRIESRYSNLTMRNVVNLTIEKRYGNLKAQSVDAMTIDVKYSECNVERIKDELNIPSLDYSTFKVKEVAVGFKKIQANARYGNLEVSIPANASFKVDATNMKYGNVDVNGFKITDSRIDNKTDYHYQINGGGTSIIQFDGNSYGNLKIRTL